VIGFDTSSWILARRCYESGVPFILDQSTAHPDSKIKSYARLRTEFPEWGTIPEGRSRDVRQAEQQEHDLADVIVAASSFGRRTLIESGVAKDKIYINTYGVDAAKFEPKQHNSSHPLRFVFVGAVSAHKGAPLLLQTWHRLRPSAAELWLVGPFSESIRPLLDNYANLRVLGAVEYRELPNILQQCDVFVFPSYSEGFGRVITEAMACGLPVISTDATAAPDIYRDCEAGWIIPAGDGEALASRMEECLAEPARVRAAGRMARRIAEQLTWKAYGERWVNILDIVMRQR
jgi:glycosyltransferase involved in cell wall biosynthesis